MTLTLDIADDLVEVADFLQAVTVRAYKATSGGVAVANALRRAVNYREVSAGGALMGDTRWHLPYSEHPAQPTLGGLIIEEHGAKPSPAEWTILDVSLETGDVRWACQCRNLAVAFGLDALVTRWRASYSAGRHGEAKPRFVQKEGIPASIRLDSAGIDNEHGARVGTKQYTISLGRPLPNDFDMALDHFIGADGTIYKPTGFSNAEAIGELTTITAEVTPWPST